MWRAAVATSLLLGEDESALSCFVPPGEMAAQRGALHIGSTDRLARARALAGVAASVLTELEALQAPWPFPEESTK